MKTIATSGRSKVAVLGIKGLLADGGEHSTSVVSTNSSNALFDHYVDYVHSVVPSTELGASLALLDEKKAAILAEIDTSKLTSVKAVNDAVFGWTRRYKKLDSPQFTLEGANLGLTRSVLKAFNIPEADIQLVSAINGIVFENILSRMIGDKSLLPEWMGRLTSTNKHSVQYLIDYFLAQFEDESLSNDFQSVVLEKSNLFLEAAASLDYEKITDAKEGEGYKIKTSIIGDAFLISHVLMADDRLNPEFFTFPMFKFWCQHCLKASLLMAISVDAKKADSYSSTINGQLEKIGKLIRSVSIEKFAVSPDGWGGHKIGSHAFADFLDSTFGTSTFKEVIVSQGIAFHTDISNLLKESANFINKGSASALEDLVSTVDAITSFQGVISNFYSDKLNILGNSYESCNELMRDHKKLLSQLRASNDVGSARNHINVFLKKPSFSHSISGILHSLSSMTDEIDRHLLTDVFSFGVTSDMTTSFRNSPFAKLADLKVDDRYRINDYGSNVSGFGLTSRVKVASKVRFLESGDIQYADIDHDHLKKVIEKPETIKTNALWYQIFGMLMLVDGPLRSQLSGQSEMTTVGKNFSFSQSIKEDLMPAVRHINNCVGAQLYLHKIASKEWLREFLASVVDSNVVVAELFDFESKKLVRSAYLESASENLKAYDKIARELYKEVFNTDLPQRVPGLVPVVNFFDIHEKLVTDKDEIVHFYVSKFRKNGGYYQNYLDKLRYIGRMVALTSNQALEYKEAANIINVKSSTFMSFAAIKSFDVLELSAPKTIDPSSLMEIPSAEILDYEKSSARTLTNISWLKLVSISDVLALIRGDKGFLTSEFSHAVLGAHMSEYGTTKTGLTPFTQEFIQTRIFNRLNKMYTMDSFSGIRSIIAQKSLSYASSCILKLATSHKEGRELGFEPIRKTVTTASKEYVFDQILASVGLGSKMHLSKGDKTFFHMIDNYYRAGGVLKLTKLGYEAMRSLAKVDEEMVPLTDLIQLDDEKFMFDPNKIISHSFFLRPSEIIDLIFQDTFRINYSDDYDVWLLEDGVVASIRSSVYDMSAIAIELVEELEVTETADNELIKSAIFNICDGIESVLFPIIDADNTPKPPTPEEEEVEE